MTIGIGEIVRIAALNNPFAYQRPNGITGIGRPDFGFSPYTRQPTFITISDHRWPGHRRLAQFAAIESRPGVELYP